MVRICSATTDTSPSPSGPPGPGGVGWCFNTGLLNDCLFKKALGALVGGLPHEIFLVDDVLRWWVGVKRRIKSLAVKLGRAVKTAGRVCEADLRAELELELHRIASDTAWPHDRSISLTEQLKEFVRERCKGAAVRSRASFLTNGEDCVAYYKAAEKSRCYITEVLDAEGTVVGGARAVVRVARDHFARG